MISPAEILVLGLAGYRGTQLVVHDSLLDPVRDRVMSWHERNAESPWRTALVTLISCIYCTGWWIAGAFLAAWLLLTGQWHDAPLLLHAIEWFTVAGAAALLNRWDDSRKSG